LDGVLPVLSIDKLTAGYDGVIALHGVDMRIPEKSIVTVVGSNGAGKSTLINAISHMVDIYTGQIRFEDVEISGLTPPEIVDRGIIQVPEGRQLFGPLTVEENLRLGFFRLHGRSEGASFRERLDYVYGLFPRLKERLTQRAATLSGGEQQMVAVGRALMADPKLLLLDEPSLGLAPMMVERIFEVLQTLRKQGITMLLVEQRADAALDLADYAYVLAVGQVAAEGPANELKKDLRVAQSYLGAVPALRKT
jgi:branched-chain amino acid transport system ATP-binding protein